MQRKARLFTALIVPVLLGFVLSLPAQAAYREADVQSTMSGSRLVITDKAGNPITGEVEGIDEDGVRRIVPYKNGLREGLAREYYPGGKLRAETPYKDGARHGTEKRYFENGALQAEKPYAYDKLNGLERYFYPSGKTQWEMPYTDGRKNGLERRYDEDGTLREEVTWADNKQQGQARTFAAAAKPAPAPAQPPAAPAEEKPPVPDDSYQAPEGDAPPRRSAPCRTELFTDDQGHPYFLYGCFTVYDRANDPSAATIESGMIFGGPDASGRVYYTGEPAIFELGTGKRVPSGGLLAELPLGPVEQWSGVAKLYYPEGGLKAEQTWSGGKRNGVEKRYGYTKGNKRFLQIETPYVNDLEQGVQTGYYPDGKQKWQTTFVNGVVHGPHREWYPSGAVHWETRFDHGVVVEDKEYPDNSRPSAAKSGANKPANSGKKK